MRSSPANGVGRSSRCMKAFCLSFKIILHSESTCSNSTEASPVQQQIQAAGRWERNLVQTLAQIAAAHPFCRCLPDGSAN